MTASLYPITGEHLFTIFSDKRFQDHMRILGNPLDSHERTFEVLHSLSSDAFTITPVAEGTETRTIPEHYPPSSGTLKREDDLFWAGEDTYCLVDMHSHPGGPSAPSSVMFDPLDDTYVGDLTLLGMIQYVSRSSHGVITSPLAGIVSSQKKKKSSSLLLFQEKSVLLLDELLEQEGLFDGFSVYAPVDDVARMMESTGLYHAVGVRCVDGKFPSLQKCLLERFAFTPRKIGTKQH